jgi:NAD(P)-dependent dehydrogenase (short-subunit alcohol dehydrogenase family)
VWGASGGIGRALVAALAEDWSVHAGSRTPIDVGTPFHFDLRDEASIATATERIAADGPVDLTIVATGVLRQPEKSFAALSAEAMIDAYRINTIGPALIAKHMIQALPRDRRSVFAALSARVGSIGDNRLGGWHSYRASKAALNMTIANLAIELRRTRPQAIAIGLHPGTVDTDLSAPFQKGVATLFTPEVSARHLLSVIAAVDGEASGGVFAWDGQRIVP